MKQPARAANGKPASKTKRKSREDLNIESRDRKRDKKHRGNTSGSRTNPEKQPAASGKPGVKAKDPRLGSKKPIALQVESNNAPVKKAANKAVEKTAQPKVRLSPEEELAKLENDERLDSLLDRLENGESLTSEEQAWLDETLDRIDELMETLGIAIDDADDDQAEEDMYRLLKGN